jgi:predicted adenine nucleotide alpha hydrolase (AANH) superfamily ATPase
MEEFKQKAQRVLEGKAVSFTTTELLSPDKAEKILLELGVEDVDDFDCNGWDWDFWKKYSKDEVYYTLSGSGWYNNGLTFSKD